MTQLVLYEAARNALAQAHRVDEVKDIRDKAEAMAAYARQAKDQKMILWATEIKVRAERKAGTMLADMGKRGERALQGDGPRFKRAASSASEPVRERPKTLSDLGVKKRESHRWQQLASMSEDHFEAAVATAKDTAGQVTTAFMLREKNRVKPRKLTKRDQEKLKELDSARERGVSMLTTYARLTLTALRSQKQFDSAELSVLRELALAINQVSN